MPYIGHGVTNAGTFYILDDLTMSSSATYTMQVGGVSVTPKADNLLITLDGVVQHTPDAYTVSGSTITFDSAPGSGVDFYGIIMGQSATIGQGSIGADELKVTGDGSSGQVLTSDGDGTFSWATDTENYLPLAGGTVTGDITLSGAKLLVADSAQGIFGANDGDTGIRWETNDVLAFDTQNAERLTIHADGQVKIAGSVANQQLYVEQDNTSNEAVKIIGPAATSATVAVLNVMTNNGASADTGLKVMQNGAVGIGLDTPEAPLHIVNSSNQLRLATDSTSGHAMLSHRSDDKLNIYSFDGTNYTDILLGVDGSSVGGKVGIGTASPSTVLSVISDLDSGELGFNVKHSNLSQGISIGYQRIKAYGTDTNAGIYIDGKGSGNLLLQSVATGLVGIGTNSPTGKLEIQGTAIGSGVVDADYFKALKLSIADGTEWGGQAQFSVGRWQEYNNEARSSLVISLGHGQLNSDSNADGGGLVLKGTSDKTILWDNTNDNFTSTDHWNIATGKSFKINNVVVANSTQLGTALRTEVLNKAESDALALAIALG